MARKAMRIAERSTNRPTARGAMSLIPPGARTRRKGESNITELFDLGGRFDRNELSHSEINRLRELIDDKTAHVFARELGIDASTLYAAAAGFGHRLARKTAAKIRDFLR